MVDRDYKSFSRLAGRLFRTVSAALEFQRVTDLQTPDKGQGYDCSSTAALEDAIAQVHADLKLVAMPWFRTHTSVEQVAATYYDRWGLRPLGTNLYVKRLGVRQYAFIQLMLGNRESALEWLHEACNLETEESDQEDRQFIERVIHELARA